MNLMDFVRRRGYEIDKLHGSDKIRAAKKQEAFAVAKASWLGSFSDVEIIAHQLLHQLVPVQLTDHAAGIVVVGDIGGIFCEQVADDLIDGIIAFFIQSIEYTTQNPAHIFLVIAGNRKLDGTLCHGFDLLNSL